MTPARRGVSSAASANFAFKPRLRHVVCEKIVHRQSEGLRHLFDRLQLRIRPATCLDVLIDLVWNSGELRELLLCERAGLPQLLYALSQELRRLGHAGRMSDSKFGNTAAKLVLDGNNENSNLARSLLR